MFWLLRLVSDVHHLPSSTSLPFQLLSHFADRQNTHSTRPIGTIFGVRFYPLQTYIVRKHHTELGLYHTIQGRTQQYRISATFWAVSIPASDLSLHIMERATAARRDGPTVDVDVDMEYDTDTEKETRLDSSEEEQSDSQNNERSNSATADEAEQPIAAVLSDESSIDAVDPPRRYEDIDDEEWNPIRSALLTGAPVIPRLTRRVHSRQTHPHPDEAGPKQPPPDWVAFRALYEQEKVEQARRIRRSRSSLRYSSWRGCVKVLTNVFLRMPLTLLWRTSVLLLWLWVLITFILVPGLASLVFNFLVSSLSPIRWTLLKVPPRDSCIPPNPQPSIPRASFTLPSQRGDRKSNTTNESGAPRSMEEAQDEAVLEPALREQTDGDGEPHGPAKDDADPDDEYEPMPRVRMDSGGAPAGDAGKAGACGDSLDYGTFPVLNDPLDGPSPPDGRTVSTSSSERSTALKQVRISNGQVRDISSLRIPTGPTPDSGSSRGSAHSATFNSVPGDQLESSTVSRSHITHQCSPDGQVDDASPISNNSEYTANWLCIPQKAKSSSVVRDPPPPANASEQEMSVDSRGADATVLHTPLRSVDTDATPTSGQRKRYGTFPGRRILSAFRSMIDGIGEELRLPAPSPLLSSMDKPERHSQVREDGGETQSLIAEERSTEGHARNDSLLSLVQDQTDTTQRIENIPFQAKEIDNEHSQSIQQQNLCLDEFIPALTLSGDEGNLAGEMISSPSPDRSARKRKKKGAQTSPSKRKLAKCNSFGIDHSFSPPEDDVFNPVYSSSADNNQHAGAQLKIEPENQGPRAENGQQEAEGDIPALGLASSTSSASSFVPYNTNIWLNGATWFECPECERLFETPNERSNHFKDNHGLYPKRRHDEDVGGGPPDPGSTPVLRSVSGTHELDTAFMVLSSFTPFEPDPSRYLGRGLSFLPQLLSPCVPLCEHRPKWSLYADPPPDVLSETAEPFQSSDSITSRSEEAYLSTCMLALTSMNDPCNPPLTQIFSDKMSGLPDHLRPKAVKEVRTWGLNYLADELEYAMKIKRSDADADKEADACHNNDNEEIIQSAPSKSRFQLRFEKALREVLHERKLRRDYLKALENMSVEYEQKLLDLEREGKMSWQSESKPTGKTPAGLPPQTSTEAKPSANGTDVKDFAVDADKKQEPSRPSKAETFRELQEFAGKFNLKNLRVAPRTDKVRFRRKTGPDAMKVNFDDTQSKAGLETRKDSADALEAVSDEEQKEDSSEEEENESCRTEDYHADREDGDDSDSDDTLSRPPTSNVDVVPEPHALESISESHEETDTSTSEQTSSQASDNTASDVPDIPSRPHAAARVFSSSAASISTTSSERIRRSQLNFSLEKGTASG